MDKSARIYVAGHRGLVGSALMQRLQAGGYTCQAGCPSAVSGRSRHTGQDGAYLAKFLLHKGCEAHGIKRARFFLHPGEMNDWQPAHQELQQGLTHWDEY